MYKVLIVDDEPLSLCAVRMFIEQNFPQLQIIGEALNGKMAIEQSDLLHPDIIIMDITMPVLNGIEASKEILLRFPTMHILILTAYDTFEYAKQAINIGITGYLLKPLKNEEIISKLQDIIITLNREREIAIQKNKINTHLQLAKPVIEKELITYYTTGVFDINIVKSYELFLNFSINSGYFLAISIDDDLLKTKQSKSTIQTIKKAIFLFRPCIIGDLIGHVLPIFIPFSSGYNHDYALKESTILAEECIKHVHLRFNKLIRIGVGSIYSNTSDFKFSYKDALLALSKTAKGYVLHISHLNTSSFITPYPHSLEQNLLKSLKAQDYDLCRTLGTELIDYLSTHSFSLLELKDYCQTLLLTLKKSMIEFGFTIGEIQHLMPIIHFEYTYNPNDFLNPLNTFISTLIYETAKKNLTKSSRLIEHINAFIAKNLFTTLSLESLATHLSLTPPYVSKLFKDEYGENFIDYINMLRLEKAKELLTNTTTPIKLISEKCGYNDPNYFSKVFKKSVGLSPKDYRKFVGDSIL